MENWRAAIVVMALACSALTGRASEVRAVGGDVELRWASHVDLGGSPPFEPESALGRPDGTRAGFSTPGAEAIYSAFGQTEAFTLDTFAALLQVSPVVLQAADFLATDVQGGTGPFESSVWTFSSDGGSKVEAIRVPEDTVHVLSSKDVPGASFASFFGFAQPAKGYDAVTVALIDLRVVNPLAPDFAVRINRTTGVNGEPDPDGIAVISVRGGEPQGCKGDLDGNNQVSVDELITSVNSALDGCDAPAILGNRYTGQGQEILFGNCNATTGAAQPVTDVVLEVTSQDGSGFTGTYLRRNANGELLTAQVTGTVDATGRFTTGSLLAAAGPAGGEFRGAFCGQVTGNQLTMSYTGQDGTCMVVGSLVAGK